MYYRYQAFFVPCEAGSLYQRFTWGGGVLTWVNGSAGGTPRCLDAHGGVGKSEREG